MSTKPAPIGKFIPLNPRDGTEIAFPDRIGGAVKTKKAAN